MKKIRKRLILVICILLCTIIAGVNNNGVKAAQSEETSDNGTMFQYFEWYLPSDGTLWSDLSKDAGNLADSGFTAVWMPPAYKGTSSQDVGYGPYDLYDLGEFNQKGTIRTKYGTRTQYLNAISSLHKNGIQAYADIVLDHKSAADTTENVNAVKVSGDNRNNVYSSTISIKAWTKFNFSARNNKYSSFKWDASCFDGVDYDQNTGDSAVFRFANKNWDWIVDSENSNYDYLMYADIDFDNTSVVNELKSWGKWYVDTANLDGFRLDAVKHIKFSFFKDWLTTLRKSTGKELFSVGEYWSGDISKLNAYISETGGTTSLFDVPLHNHMYAASTGNSGYDMRNMFKGTLVEANPVLAVTFADNHDTQNGQSLQSEILDWFKPLAYTIILTREGGYPCVFYGDYYGTGNDKNGKTFKTEIDRIMKARQYYAYGTQHDYLDNENIIGWTREGDTAHEGSGLASIITDGPGGSKTMYVGRSHAGEVWKDITGNRISTVTITSQGYGTFYVNGGSTSIYVNSASMSVDMSKTSVSISKNKYVYTGKVIKPSASVKYNGKTLVMGKDYTVSYSNNKNAGIASVVITGIGRNTGTKTIKFTILPTGISGISSAGQTRSSVTIKWNKASGGVSGYQVYKYNSTKKKYEYVANITSGNTVKYTNKNVSAGRTYKFYVKAYKKVGTTRYYGANSKVITVCTQTNAPKVKLSTSKRKVKVKWGKVSGATGYVVYYKTSAGGKYKKLKTLSSSKTSYSKSSLKKGKRYYFRVVAYKKVSGKTVYSTGSVKNIVVK